MERSRAVNIPFLFTHAISFLFLLVVSMSVCVCRGTSGELKREPLATKAESPETLLAEGDEYQFAFNSMLNDKPVPALSVLNALRQFQFYHKNQSSKIRPVRFGGSTGILACNFEESLCSIVENSDSWSKLFLGRLTSFLRREIESRDWNESLRIGRMLAEINPEYMSAFDLATLSNKKNAAAFQYGLISKEKIPLSEESNALSHITKFLELAKIAYPNLEFASGIGSMDKREVKIVAAKLTKMQTNNDVVFAKFIEILRQDAKDRLVQITEAEREVRETEQKQQAEEAATRSRLRNFCASYCLSCRYSQRKCVHIASQQCNCW